jgi:predicted DNA-binding transcriptional regulator YafY
VSETAAGQLRRLLEVIPRVADDRDHTVAELAELAGVDLATLIDDLLSLTQRFDSPGGFVEGVTVLVDGSMVSVSANHFLRPMRLTMPELCALELGLAVLRGERAPTDHAPIERAMARLRDVITKLPSNDAWSGVRHVELPADGSPEHLSAIRAALRSRRALRIAYRRPGEADAGIRTVCPYALVYSAGAWYVVAHCAEREGVRIYRLDRIASVEETAERYAIPEGFSVEAVLADGKPLSGEAHQTMRIRYSPRIARWIAEREGRDVGADGSLVLEHPLHDAEWGVRHVLQYGADAEVLGPEAMRALVARRVEGMRAGV